MSPGDLGALGWEASERLQRVERTIQSRPPMQSGGGRRSSPLTWRWIDRLALAFAWAAGIGLCLIAGAIVVYMGYRGIQYLRPSLRHHPVLRWVEPSEFDELGALATEIGFLGVMSGPLVRSSYRAGRLYRQAMERRAGPVSSPSW